MKKLYLAMLSLLMSAPLSAQESNMPYWWVGASGGAAMSLSPSYSSILDKGPAVSLSVGYMPCPEIGVRLYANKVLKARGLDYTVLDEHTHRLDYFTADVDMLTNLCTAFGKKDYYPLDLYLILGVGYNMRNESKSSIDEANNIFGYNHDMTCSDFRDDVNLRAGLMLEYKFAKHWGLTAETAINTSRIWTAELGLVYKFGKGFKRSVAAVPVPAPVQEVKPAPVQEVKPEPVKEVKPEPVKEVKPEPVKEVKPEPVKEVKPAANVVEPCTKNVFFAINRYDIRPEEMEKIKSAIELLKKYPDAKIDITGYADRNTGNAEVNKRVSKARMNAVYDVLIKNGIAASRITKGYKGDTVQPFTGDDFTKNRCVICIVE